MYLKWVLVINQALDLLEDSLVNSVLRARTQMDRGIEPSLEGSHHYSTVQNVNVLSTIISCLYIPELAVHGKRYFWFTLKQVFQ